ncbi:hypothetical protein, partial [Xenorhabdus miraniensis]|uniref:hypothetical protein n=1 Tax=Xenorhabdus miraniensis TaxID=351674 RepID=UPI00142D80DA
IAHVPPQTPGLTGSPATVCPFSEPCPAQRGLSGCPVRRGFGLLSGGFRVSARLFLLGRMRLLMHGL